MKLSEIKTGLIEHFFTKNSNGVAEDRLNSIFEMLGKTIGGVISEDRLNELSLTNQSSDPSKAFKKFTEGKNAFLTILEEDGSNTNAIFAAIRLGKQVAVVNLTEEEFDHKVSDLSTVKQALKQAKNVNEDIFFSISIEELI